MSDLGKSGLELHSIHDLRQLLFAWRWQCAVPCRIVKRLLNTSLVWRCTGVCTHGHLATSQITSDILVWSVH